MYVQLGEVFGSPQFVNKLGNKWYWIAVLNCHFVELPVVLDGS